MIELLMPLGLLGLLGIAVLIIIYILKPNYQQKVVSSTHVWKLSLRYRRKQIPINRLLSLLILLCQILIVTACALILAQPFIPSGEVRSENERIIVIDSSANMLVTSDGVTRYERAVEQASELVSTTLMEPDGVATVILATDTPEFLFRRLPSAQRPEALEELDALVSGEELQCTYRESDVTGAMELAQDVLDTNPKAEVYLYTGTQYLDDGGVKVVNVESASQMRNAVSSEFDNCDVAVMCAAVADYAPEVYYDRKIKREKNEVPVLKLKKNPDIAAELGQRKKNQLLVGFALETDNEIENAKMKIKNKNLDMIVLNSLADKNAGFGVDTNKVTIIEKDGDVHRYELKTKKEVAVDIVDLIKTKI